MFYLGNYVLPSMQRSIKQRDVSESSVHPCEVTQVDPRLRGGCRASKVKLILFFFGVWVFLTNLNNILMKLGRDRSASAKGCRPIAIGADGTVSAESSITI